MVVPGSMWLVTLRDDDAAGPAVAGLACVLFANASARAPVSNYW